MEGASVTTLLEPVVRHRTAARSSRRAVTPSSGAAVIVLRSLYAFGALMIWFVLYALVFGAVQESRSQTVLYAQFRQQLAAGVAPAGGLIKDGKPVALLEIPRLGIRDVVVEGTAPRTLLLGPGHRADSPLPGEAGVSVLYGRGATFGAPFGRLVKLRAGDTIDVVDAVGTSHYVVDGLRRAGSPLPAPLPATGARLTLASATAGGWRASVAPNVPFYVDATMQGSALAEPGGRVASVPSSNQVMGIDGGAVSSLVRWLQLLCVTTIAAAWVYGRWGRWQTWVVTVPTVGAALWLVTETAFRLLPNLL
jgi:sortase A